MCTTRDECRLGDAGEIAWEEVVIVGVAVAAAEFFGKALSMYM